MAPVRIKEYIHISDIGYNKYRVSEIWVSEISGTISDISGVRNIRYQKYWVSEILGIRNIGYQKYRVSEI